MTAVIFSEDIERVEWSELEALELAYGPKGAGLLALPRSWTPPFALIAASPSIAERWVTDLDDTILSRIRSLGGAEKLYVRSSILGETIWDRGSYASVIIDAGSQDFRADLKSAIDTVVQSAPGKDVALVIQAYVEPRARGEFGNLLRISKTKDQWELSSYGNNSVSRTRFNTQRSEYRCHSPILLLFWHQVYARKPAEILEKFRVRVQRPSVWRAFSDRFDTARLRKWSLTTDRAEIRVSVAWHSDASSRFVSAIVIPLVLFYPSIAVYLPQQVRDGIATASGGLPSVEVVQPAVPHAPPRKSVPPPKSERPTATASRAMNVHVSPASKGAVILSLQKKASVVVLGKRGNWTQIEVPAEGAGQPRQGWVWTAYLQDKDS